MQDADRDIIQNELFYKKYYNRSQQFSVKLTKKKFLGEKCDRKCRFCGSSKPETTFKQEAHVFPEWLGNKYLLSYYECDHCNDRFSLYEDSLSRFMGLARAMSGLRGKQRIYTYKPRSGKSKIKVHPDGNISLILDPTDPVANHEETEKTWNIESDGQFYVPSEIYRSLAKMALTLLAEHELSDFHETREWLLKYSRKQALWKLWILEAISPALDFIASSMNKISFRLLGHPLLARGPNALFSWFSFYSGSNPFPNLTYFAATRKSDTEAIPYMIFWVAYANFSWQIYLPFSNKDYHLSRKDLRRLPPWPVITSSDITVKHWSIDLSSSKPVRNLSVAGSWKYTHMSTSEP